MRDVLAGIAYSELCSESAVSDEVFIRGRLAEDALASRSPHGHCPKISQLLVSNFCT